MGRPVGYHIGKSMIGDFTAGPKHSRSQAVVHIAEGQVTPSPPAKTHRRPRWGRSRHTLLGG